MTNLNRCFTRCALAIALVLPVAAQQAQPQSSLAGVTRLNKAPVSTEVLQVKFPRPVESKLKNGLRVMVLEDHRTPTFAITIVMQAANLSEPPEFAGTVAGATATMLRLGTKTRTAREISDALAELGGSLSAGGGVGSRTTSVNVSGLTDNLDALLDLCADVLFNPSFPQTELDNLKQRTLSSLQSSRLR